MKLNLYILAEKLSQYNPRVQCQDFMVKDLINVSFLPDNCAEANNSYVYITTSAKIEKFSDFHELSLIILGEPDTNLSDKNCYDFIIIEEKLSEFDILSAVQSAFDYYNKWDAKLINELLSAKPIQEVLDTCSEVLTNPISLSDTANVLIAKSGVFPAEVTDIIWKSLLTHGYGKIELFPVRFRKLFEMCIAARTPVMMPPLSEPSDIRLIAAALVKDDIHFANLILTELTSKFTLGQLSLTEHIQRRLEYSNQIPVGPADYANGTSYILTQLIKGIAIEDEMIDYFLKKQHWNRSDSYYLLAANFDSGEPLNSVYRSSHLVNIKQAIPESYVLFVDNILVIIYRCTESVLNKREIVHRLRDTLCKLRWFAGMSMKFNGYENLNIAMLQATTAFDYGKTLSPGQNVYVFDEIYNYCFINSLGDKNSILEFCHPKMLAILAEKDTWKIELLKTLSVYLKNGRNTSLTTSILHIHRNTLINRLKSIEVMMDVKLDDVHGMDLDILLISCMICDEQVLEIK